MNLSERATYVTVDDTSEALSLVRCELVQRAIDDRRHDEARQRAIAALRAELARPEGHCPNQMRESDGTSPARSAAKSSDPGSDHSERSGTLAAREATS